MTGLGLWHLHSWDRNGLVTWGRWPQVAGYLSRHELGNPREAPRPRRGRDQRAAWTWWRVATPLAVLVSGGLFAVSALNSGGTDLRPGRYTDLAALVRTESRQYDALRVRVATLTDEVAAMTGAVDNDQVAQLRDKAKALEGPAGLVEQTGPGVTVVLTDAPADIAESSQQDPNRLVVHQQDIQAVVNAFWKGGASAVTIQGQRVVSTTGIKCIGNAVQLQGVPYSQPTRSPASATRRYWRRPSTRTTTSSSTAATPPSPTSRWGGSRPSRPSSAPPPYDGLLDITYAMPLETTAG